VKARVGGVALVVGAVAAIAIYKAATAGSSPAASPVPAATPSVVLVADMREAESECGCGEIIRSVREAGDRGVTVLLAEPGSEAARTYRATVSPTVLFLDARGEVEARYEGEEADTVDAIAARLRQTAAASP